MKKIDWYDDIVAPLIVGTITVSVAWLIYKVLAGAYHLLDKLIDKL